MTSGRDANDPLVVSDDLAVADRLSIIDRLLEISDVIISEMDLSSALQMVAECAADAVKAESTAVGLIDWSTKELHYVQGFGVFADKITGVRTPLTKSIRTLVSKSGKPVVINDVAADERVPQRVITEWGIRSLLVVPLKVRKKVIGALLAANRHGGPFAVRDLRAFETIANHGAAAVAHADLHTRARTAFLQLEKEKTKIEAVLAQLGDGVVVSDARNRVIMVNSTAGKIIGLAHEDILGRNLVDIHPKPFRPEVRAILEQLSRSKPAAGLFWEQNINLPDGKVVHINMRPVFLKSGVFVGIASLLQDITDSVALDEAKTEFISTVAHELRTPLTSLKGSLGLALGGAVGEINPGLRTMLGVAENSCNKLIRLVDDMLDMAKIEAGHLSLEMDIISVQERVKSAVDRMRQFASERQVCLSVKVTGRQHKVIGDGDRIEQVVINLLSNAIKFSPAGASVEVTVGRKGSCVKVSVTDHGPGIAPAEQKKIFEKFYRAAGQDQPKTNSSGLGLSISKGIIEQHGSRISVKSAPGKGSTFSFALSIPGEEPCLSNE
ncbi:MAG: ATP-binding protein [Armatimonadota bacterium]